MIAWLLIAGCLRAPRPDDTDVTPIVEPPSIDAFQLACDPDRERWTLEVGATSWTGGGTLWLTVDGDYVEQHGVRSVEAAADGSSDRLVLRLNIVADWRSTTSGSSTALRCSQGASYLFALQDLDGDVVDCRIGGPAPDTLQGADFPGCASDTGE